MADARESRLGVSLEEVLRLHDQGFSLLPLGPIDDERNEETRKQRKHPDYRVLPRSKEGKSTWEPFQTTKATREQVITWFGNGTPRNVAIVCGPSCGVYLIVIDSDSDEKEAACREVLPPTPMMTKTAKGYHRYYRAPYTTLPPFIYVNGHEIELKRLGNYVVAPGSLHPSGVRYEMVGEWPLLEDVPVFPEALLSELTWVPDATINGTSRPVTAPPLPEVVSDGSRNNTLFREAGRLRRLGWNEEEIYIALTGLNKRTTTPLDDRELRGIAHSAMRYAPAADVFPLTESGDAEYFAAVNADLVRYDHLRSRWLVFIEHHWRPPTTGEVHRLALDAMRGRQDAARNLKDDDQSKQRRKLWAVRGEERKRLTNMLELAKNQKQLADDGENWDKDPWLLGVENGVVDLRTGTLRAGRPEDRITMCTACAFDPGAKCPVYDKAIDAIFGHDVELVGYMDRFFGYSLTGDCREEKLGLCWGEGGNGKSTLLNIVRHILKDYADTLPFSSLEVKKFSDAPPYDLAKLVGKRFVTASETIDERRLNEGRIKGLTGRDPVDARFPYGRWFSYIPDAKFWLSANVKPKTEDTSEGWWRRVEFIPFTQTFKDKPESGQNAANQKLKDQLLEELPGILARLVRGCLDWQQRGLDSPAAVREATKQYRAESEPLQRFIDECCVVGENKSVSSGPLFDAYVRWSKSEDGIRLGNQKFYQVMAKKFERVEGRPVMYRGIGLLETRFEDRDAGVKETRDGDIPF